MPDQDQKGEQFGSYYLLRLLGEGTYGVVYLGQHLYLDTQVAVKIMQARLSKEHWQLFRDEACKIPVLDHPHIVRLLDFSMKQGIPFLESTKRQCVL